MKGKRGRPKKATFTKANLQNEIMFVLSGLFLGLGRELKKTTKKRSYKHTAKASGTGKRRGRPRKVAPVTVESPEQPETAQQLVGGPVGAY